MCDTIQSVGYKKTERSLTCFQRLRRLMPSSPGAPYGHEGGGRPIKQWNGVRGSSSSGSTETWRSGVEDFLDFPHHCVEDIVCRPPFFQNDAERFFDVANVPLPNSSGFRISWHVEPPSDAVQIESFANNLLLETRELIFELFVC